MEEQLWTWKTMLPEEGKLAAEPFPLWGGMMDDDWWVRERESEGHY
jgi:hypothetical protein